MHIEEYRNYDKDQIIDLFNIISGKRWTDEFWNWRFNENVFGSPIRYVMRENDKIVGNYVVHPMLLQAKGQIHQVLFSMNTFTHPEYRGKGIMQQLAQKTFEKAKDLNYKIIFGFPNQNSYWIFFNKLNWVNFGNVKVFRKKTESRVLINESKYTIEPIKEFSSEIDQLWENHRDLYGVVTPRTSAYLKWRYQRCPPIKWAGSLPSIYCPFIIRMKGIAVGYFVIKIFEGVKGHIVDCFGNLEKSMLELICRYAINFCVSKGLSELTLWSNEKLENNGLSTICNNLGFSEEHTQEFWGFRTLDGTAEAFISNKMNWFITMGDSDVY